MNLNLVEFSELEEKVKETSGSPKDYLAPELGKAYVVAVTRDGCPACTKQKPELDSLAAIIAEKHKDRVVFTRIHIKYSEESTEESVRSKKLLGHYFYPTNIVLLKTTDRGAIEYYKAASPSMEELETKVEQALEIAKAIEKGKT